MLKFTSEYFESVGITVSQPGQGHRYGSESLMLADFCRVKGRDRVAELGSGCGVISLVIAARDKPRHIAAIELQQRLHNIALKNVEMNNLGGVIRCENKDWRQFAIENPQSFDCVVSNPPFYRKGSGRQGDNLERATARHELAGSILDMVESAKTLLVSHGRFAIVFTGTRKAELLTTTEMYGFEVKRIIEKREKRDWILLAEFCKSPCHRTARRVSDLRV